MAGEYRHWTFTFTVDASRFWALKGPESVNELGYILAMTTARVIGGQRDGHVTDSRGNVLGRFGWRSNV